MPQDVNWSKSPQVVELLRPAQGSSQPWFCLLDDGREVLVKFAGAGPGPAALAAEFMAAKLGRYWGLPVPKAFVVQKGAELPKKGTDEFWDVLRNSVGPNLAVALVDGALNRPFDESLPPALIQEMLDFDTIIQNWDRTIQSRNLLLDRHERIWLIDHGSARFLHNATGTPRGLPNNHALRLQVGSRQASDKEWTIPPKATLADWGMALPTSWCLGNYGGLSLGQALATYLSKMASEVPRLSD